MFLQCARVSILRAEKENGYSDVASILGPDARVGKISQCACAFLDESLAWVLRKSLFYECTTSACNSPLLKPLYGGLQGRFPGVAPMRLPFTSHIVEHSRYLPDASLHHFIVQWLKRNGQCLVRVTDPLTRASGEQERRAMFPPGGARRLPPQCAHSPRGTSVSIPGSSPGVAPSTG
jgi:hypothetical protein